MTNTQSVIAEKKTIHTNVDFGINLIPKAKSSFMFAHQILEFFLPLSIEETVECYVFTWALM